MVSAYQSKIRPILLQNRRGRDNYLRCFLSLEGNDELILPPLLVISDDDGSVSSKSPIDLEPPAAAVLSMPTKG